MNELAVLVAVAAISPALGASANTASVPAWSRLKPMETSCGEYVLTPTAPAGYLIGLSAAVYTVGGIPVGNIGCQRHPSN